MDFFDKLLPYLLSGISVGGQYALIAVGYTMVYGILRLINFAHGDVFIVSGLMMVYAVTWMPLWLAIPFVIVFTVLLGFLIERVAYKPLRSAPRMSVMISAIGVSYLLQNLALYVTGGLNKNYPTIPWISDTVSVFGATTKMVTLVTPVLTLVLVVLLVLLIGILFGLFQGFCVGYLEIQPFIVSMAGMFFARGMTAVISTAQLSITAEADQTFYDMANFRIYLPFGGTINRAGKLIMPYVGIGVVIALAVLVVFFLMLRYTKFGRALYAVGGSEQSAAMMGLNVKATKMKAYVLSSFLCSIGGICYCMNTMSASVNQATGLEMDAIASSVIGGTLLTGGVGNVIGTLFGVLINGTIASIVQFNGKLASSWPNVLTAALLCFFIVLQSIFAKIKERNK